MIVALYIFLSLVVVGGLLYFLHVRDVAKEKSQPEAKPAQEAPSEPQEEECCGMHITCEKDSLLASVSKEIEYYDDEELDAYRGREPQDYTDEEIEQFRDVLLTLLPTDIAGWGRSLQLRGISLPTSVREELLMIVAEQRALHT
ncbi:MAG: phospholipase [Bacteroidales bacterium]|nr:phospholipase [Bacteroidales bacterium]